MKCENCKKFIWYWNPWRKKRGIVIDRKHPKYMLTIVFCSEKCYVDYSESWKWFSKKPKDFLGFFKKAFE